MLEILLDRNGRLCEAECGFCSFLSGRGARFGHSFCRMLYTPLEACAA